MSNYPFDDHRLIHGVYYDPNRGTWDKVPISVFKGTTEQQFYLTPVSPDTVAVSQLLREAGNTTIKAAKKRTRYYVDKVLFSGYFGIGAFDDALNMKVGITVDGSTVWIASKSRTSVGVVATAEAYYDVGLNTDVNTPIIGYLDAQEHTTEVLYATVYYYEFDETRR